jgi:uncharacterized protein YbcV (DUF1398 family)
MVETTQIIAQECLDAAYNGTKSFPEIVGNLIENGFESYRIDYMRHVATYFLSDNSSFELPLPNNDTAVTKTFDAANVQAAIKEAQQQVEGYTYKGFCEKITNAGCAGYIVSFLGKRVLYFGRTAETHVEYFPQ